MRRYLIWFSMNSMSLSLSSLTSLPQERQTLPHTMPSFQRLTLNSRSPSTTKYLWILPSFSPSLSHGFSITAPYFQDYCLRGSMRRGLLSYTYYQDQLPSDLSFFTPLILILCLFRVGLTSTSSPSYKSTTSSGGSSSSCFLSLEASLAETLIDSLAVALVGLAVRSLNSLRSLSTSVRCWTGSQVQSLDSGQPTHLIRYIMPLEVSFLSII